MSILNEPLLLTPWCKQTIWGGERLVRDYQKPSKTGKLGESWELTVREKEQNILPDGTTLNSLLGERAIDFPLLVKFLDAGDDLSVQVHPVKSEMWYIVDCDEGAELVYGLSRPYHREAFLDDARNGRIDPWLRRVKVHKGETWFIPQGLVHAIGAGILVAEIQENSDITHRVYDYDRRQPDGTLRELHIDEAANDIRDFSDQEISAARFSSGTPGNGVLASCRSFAAVLHECSGAETFRVHTGFSHLLILSGSGTVGNLKVGRGDSVYLDQSCGSVRIDGNLKYIESYAN